MHTSRFNQRFLRSFDSVLDDEMRRTNPFEPLEPIEPAPFFHTRHVPRANSNPIPSY